MKALTNPERRRAASRAGAAFTLVEILVSAMLLTLSLSAVVTLWSVSRSTTERSRDMAEYYIVAHHEAERYRTAGGFSTIFDPRLDVSVQAPSMNVPHYTDYGRYKERDTQGQVLREVDGVRLGTVSTKTAARTEGQDQLALYRVESTFYLQPGSAGDTLQMLGVHVIRVFLFREDGTIQATDDDVYRTTLFFSARGV